MTDPAAGQTSPSPETDEEAPQDVPANIWGTLIFFAAFVALFATCGSFFLFD